MKLAKIVRNTRLLNLKTGRGALRFPHEIEGRHFVLGSAHLYTIRGVGLHTIELLLGDVAQEMVVAIDGVHFNYDLLGSKAGQQVVLCEEHSSWVLHRKDVEG